MTYKVFVTPGAEPDYYVMTNDFTSFRQESDSVQRFECKFPIEERGPIYMGEDNKFERFVQSNPISNHMSDSIYYPYVKRLYENIANMEALDAILMEIKARFGLYQMRIPFAIMFYWVVNLTYLAKTKTSKKYAIVRLDDAFVRCREGL